MDIDKFTEHVIYICNELKLRAENEDTEEAREAYYWILDNCKRFGSKTIAVKGLQPYFRNLFIPDEPME